MLETYSLKPSCFCPFKLSNSKTYLDKSWPFTNDKRVFLHHLMHTYWSNHVFCWKKQQHLGAMAFFHYQKFVFLAHAKLLASLVWHSFGRNITCKEHWRFSVPAPGWEIHVLRVEPLFAVNIKRQWTLINIKLFNRLVSSPFVIITWFISASPNTFFSKCGTPLHELWNLFLFFIFFYFFAWISF